jgi:hypothetical protein
VAAVVSLALGIGANTAIFRLIDQLILQMLPAYNPEQLVLLSSVGDHYGSNTGSNAIYNGLRTGAERRLSSEVRDSLGSFGRCQISTPSGLAYAAVRTSWFKRCALVPGILFSIDGSLFPEDM